LVKTRVGFFFSESVIKILFPLAVVEQTVCSAHLRNELLALHSALFFFESIITRLGMIREQNTLQQEQNMRLYSALHSR
jgi:hypothetical protein